MPLKLDLMSVDDIPEFADVDDRAMANYGFAQAMAAASPSDQSRKEICEYWTRQSFANDKDVTWLKVTDTETNKLIAAASWRVPLEGIEAPEVATSAEKADDEPLLTSWGLVSEESKDGEEKPNFFAVVLKMRNEFVDEYMCGRPYACKFCIVSTRCNPTVPARQARQVASYRVQFHPSVHCLWRYRELCTDLPLVRVPLSIYTPSHSFLESGYAGISLTHCR